MAAIDDARAEQDTVPSREQAASAAAVFDDMYRRWQQALATLDARDEIIAEQRGRIHTLQKQVDDRDEHIFRLEQANHHYAVGLQELFGLLAGAGEDAARASERIARVNVRAEELALQTAAVMQGRRFMTDRDEYEGGHER